MSAKLPHEKRKLKTVSKRPHCNLRQINKETPCCVPVIREGRKERRRVVGGGPGGQRSVRDERGKGGCRQAGIRRGAASYPTGLEPSTDIVPQTRTTRSPVNDFHQFLSNQ